VEQIADVVEILISKDCAYCALVGPVLTYAVKKGYIGLVQQREYEDKQEYLRTIEEIAKKYQQRRYYPVVLIHHAGKEMVLPPHVIDEIIDFMTSLDDQIYLQIIVGELTWEDLGPDVLVQPTSKLILGIVEALNYP